MELKLVWGKTPEIARFNKREWRAIDIEHYGAPQNFEPFEFRIIARNKKKLIGSAFVQGKNGVAELTTLIVAGKSRGSGIGSALMRRTERELRARKIHKLWLITGKGWEAEAFYKKHGFEKKSILKNHYGGIDFVLYEKFY